jgi:hypothetical protein
LPSKKAEATLVGLLPQVEEGQLSSCLLHKMYLQRRKCDEEDRSETAAK